MTPMAAALYGGEGRKVQQIGLQEMANNNTTYALDPTDYTCSHSKTLFCCPFVVQFRLQEQLQHHTALSACVHTSPHPGIALDQQHHWWAESLPGHLGESLTHTLKLKIQPY